MAFSEELSKNLTSDLEKAISRTVLMHYEALAKHIAISLSLNKDVILSAIQSFAPGVQTEPPIDPIKATLKSATLSESSGKILIVTDYSEKSVVVYGDTRAIKDDILKPIGCAWNSRLSHGPGWVLPKKKYSDLKIALTSRAKVFTEITSADMTNQQNPCLKPPQIGYETDDARGSEAPKRVRPKKSATSIEKKSLKFPGHLEIENGEDVWIGKRKRDGIYILGKAISSSENEMLELTEDDISRVKDAGYKT